MKITKNKLKWFGEFGDKLMDIADLYALLKYNESGIMYISEFSSTHISFHMTWETGCMGCYDKHTLDFDIPISLLAKPNWQTILKQELAEKRKIEQEKQRLEQERHNKELEDRKYLEYLSLKQQFEGK